MFNRPSPFAKVSTEHDDEFGLLMTKKKKTTTVTDVGQAHAFKSYRIISLFVLGIFVAFISLHYLTSLSYAPPSRAAVKTSLWGGDGDVSSTDDDLPTGTCALLFFGLARDFKDVVMPSIQKFVIDANPECDLYAHTYNVNTTSNSRNNELNAPVHPEDVGLLSPRLKLVMDTHEEFKAARNLTYFRTYFPHDPRFSWVYPTSMDNMIKQWHSIDRAWKAMPNDGKQYLRIGLFRLDVLYLEPMNLTATVGAAVVPRWGSPGLNETNDRMIIGDYEYTKVWATNRFPIFSEFGALHDHAVHSEDFMTYLMKDVPVTKTDLCFKRVRATGEVKDGDCPKFPKSVHPKKSHQPST